MASLLDTLDEIRSDTVTPEASPEEVGSSVEDVDTPLEPIKEKLVELTNQSTLNAAVEAIRKERAINKTTALEVFTMLPGGYSSMVGSKLSNGASTHNRDLLLNTVGLDNNLISKYRDFVTSLRDVVECKKEKYQELVSGCRVYLDIINTVVPQLEASKPTIVYNRENIKLLDHDIQFLAWELDSSILDYVKYQGKLDRLYAEVVKGPGYEFITKNKGLKTINDGDSLKLTLRDIMSYLGSRAVFCVNRSSELSVIINNLDELNFGADPNPPIPSGMFGSILSTIEAIKEDHALFCPVNSIANKVINLLRFID